MTIQLETPISEQTVRRLNVGDEVEISGAIVTARDAAHKYLLETPYNEVDAKLRGYLKDGVIYHLGPIVKKIEGKWRIISAGPTTSIREEPYEAEIIKKYGIRGIIGKGGMGKKTLKAFGQFGGVYLSAVGGAAALLASRIKEVIGVYKLEEFGMPEAMWVLKVEKFPCIVSLDSHGKSLYEQVEEKSKSIFKDIE